MQIFESPELIERMQRLAHRVLREGIFLLDAVRFDNAGNRRVPGEALLFDEKFEGGEPPTAGSHVEFSRLGAIAIEERPDAQRLQQSAPGNVLGQILDAHPRFDPPHIRVRRHATIDRRIGSLPALSRSGKRINGLHRMMRSSHLFERAYERIARNSGALTAGIDGETFDGMSLEKLASIAGD